MAARDLGPPSFLTRGSNAVKRDYHEMAAEYHVAMKGTDDVLYVDMSQDKFGSDAPKFSFPRLHRSFDWATTQSPSPAAYNPKLPKDRRILPSFPKAECDRTKPVPCETSTIDYYVLPSTLSTRGCRIGNRPGTIMDKKPEVTTPAFITVSSLNHARHHKIQSWHAAPKRHVEVSPLGPGAYDTSVPWRVTGPKIPKAQVDRAEEFLPKEATPAPSDYNPKPIDRKVATIRIGRRPVIDIGPHVIVDQYIVPLTGFRDPEAAVKWVDQMSDLRLVVAWITRLILEEKPDDPILFLHQRLQLMDRINTQFLTPLGEDDLDCFPVMEEDELEKLLGSDPPGEQPA